MGIEANGFEGELEEREEGAGMFGARCTFLKALMLSQRLAPPLLTLLL